MHFLRGCPKSPSSSKKVLPVGLGGRLFFFFSIFSPMASLTGKIFQSGKRGLNELDSFVLEIVRGHHQSVAKVQK
jgi:hypothetical protein